MEFGDSGPRDLRYGAGRKIARWTVQQNDARLDDSRSTVDQVDRHREFRPLSKSSKLWRSTRRPHLQQQSAVAPRQLLEGSQVVVHSSFQLQPDEVHVSSHARDRRERREIQTKDIFMRYAHDVFATCAFGIAIDSLADRKNRFSKLQRSSRHKHSVKNLKVISGVAQLGR
ncbi:hypothetical protein K0M31_017001 [Melipona bicolor]|uniref:Uncharacterized protein n=1 Tax=Melipona bicolor TaxID=60889 RepID=A0AA40FDM7_9HYME|nr:hypothetical protein K0M31_017001 [Melipona bicolor]